MLIKLACRRAAGTPACRSMSKPSEQMERARRSIRVEAELQAGAHEVWKAWTTVEIRIASLGPESSRVHLEHRGWGTGGQWEEAFAYFSRAWSEGVFPRLKNRFAAGNGPSPSRTPA